MFSFKTSAASLAALSILAASPAFAAGLTPQEKKLVSAAAGEKARSLGLLETLVNINSGTLNKPGVEEVGRRMQAELKDIGFDVRWVPMAQVDRAGHVVAVHKGSGKGKRMLLIGHLDTVFEPDSPFQKYVRRGDLAEGPGVNDMKGGLVIMIGALRAMKASGTLKDADITIVLTGDEERGGRPLSVSRAELINAAKVSDMALEFEGLAQENGKDMVSIARRSSTEWTLTVSARSGHSSGIFNDAVGYGAAYELARRISSDRIFRDRYKMPYSWLMAREHLNSPQEVFKVVGGHFSRIDRTFFPMRIPLVNANLCVGLTYAKI